MDGANLTFADLNRASLRGANLRAVEVHNSDGDATGQFWPTNLTETVFNDATLSDALFRQAKLEDTHFEGADMTNAQFHDCKLSEEILAVVRNAGAKVS